MFSKADIHIHTHFSPDSFSRLSSIAKKAVKRGLKVIAVTDHNEIEGAFQMKKYVEKKGLDLEVIIGEEVGTLQGHLVALFLKHRIPPNLPLKAALHEIKNQGGIVFVPHLSFSSGVQSEYNYRMRLHYQNLLDDSEVMDMIDGVEVENFTLSEPDFEAKARFFNEKIMKKAIIGASDAHLVGHVGLSYTLFEGHTAEDLRKAILSGQTQAGFVRTAHLVDLVLYWWASVRVPFFFFYEKFYEFFKATYFIVRRFIKYKDFSQKGYQEFAKEIVDTAKKVNKEKNEFYEDRTLYKQQPPRD